MRLGKILLLTMEVSPRRPEPRERRATIPECAKTKGTGSSSSLWDADRARRRVAFRCPDTGPLLPGTALKLTGNPGLHRH